MEFDLTVSEYAGIEMPVTVLILVVVEFDLTRIIWALDGEVFVLILVVVEFDLTSCLVTVEISMKKS